MQAMRRQCSFSPLPTGGLQFYTFFWNFTKVQAENDSYWQKKKFLLLAKCLKMYQFLSICIQSLQKVQIWPGKFFFSTKSIWVSKNAEFYADSKFVEMGLKKCSEKKLCAKNIGKKCKIRKTRNLHSFLLITFYRYIFANPFQRIRNQHKILRFLIPILIFWEKKISRSYLYFLQTLNANAQKLGHFREFC